MGCTPIRKQGFQNSGFRDLAVRRAHGQGILCVTVRPLFTPTLSKAGLKSDRVFYLEGGDDKTVLASATAEATLSWRKSLG